MNLLYRYFGSLDEVLDTLSNRRLFFSSPFNFKDPFDCRPKFSLVSCKWEPEDAWRRYFLVLAKLENPGISDDEAKRRADGAIREKKHRDDNWLRESDVGIKQALLDHMLKVRICCFSKSPRNSMMWAHYANNHAGLVLQFRKSAMRDDAGELREFDVGYYRRIPLSRYVQAMEDAQKSDNIAFNRLMLCSKAY